MACIDITKLTFKLSAQKMASRRFPIIWLCENGDLRARRTGQTLRVLASHHEPQDEGNLNPFVWEQTWSTRQGIPSSSVSSTLSSSSFLSSLMSPRPSLPLSMTSLLYDGISLQPISSVIKSVKPTDCHFQSESKLKSACLNKCFLHFFVNTISLEQKQ